MKKKKLIKIILTILMLLLFCACDEVRTEDKLPSQKNVDEALHNALKVLKDRSFSNGVNLIVTNSNNESCKEETVYYNQSDVYIKYYKKTLTNSDQDNLEEDYPVEKWYAKGYEYVYDIDKKTVEKLYYDDILISNEIESVSKELFTELDMLFELEYSYHQSNAAIGPKIDYPESIVIEFDKDLLKDKMINRIHPRIEIYCYPDGKTCMIVVYLDKVQYLITDNSGPYKKIFPENADVLSRYFTE